MLVNTQNDTDARLSRNADLLAEATRNRLIAARQSPHSAMPTPIGRLRAGLRQAVTSLLALVWIG